MLIQHMKEEITYLWRIKWTGKWGTTRHHCTEEHIRKEHPEAICLPETKRVHLVPETKEEFEQRQRDLCTSAFLANK